MNQLVEKSGTGIQRAESGAMTIEDMANQVQTIQRLMREIMKEDVHYGKIPGTQKNALFKAGAEKIGLMFSLRSEYDIEQTDLTDGHREYQVTCRIHDKYGEHIGSGIGVCTTMEKKYRFRSENTGKPVPKNYWEHRDQSILGGPAFTPRKVDGKWWIFQQAEYDNPADYYNTAAKMAKKRAYNDAIITCTAASDFFDQEEVIDTPELYPKEGTTTEETASAPRRDPKAAGDGKLTQTQVKIILKKAESRKIIPETIAAEFGADKLESIPKDKANDVLEWLDTVSG